MRLPILLCCALAWIACSHPQVVPASPPQACKSLSPPPKWAGPPVNADPEGCPPQLALCFTAPDAKRLIDYLGSLVIWSREAWLLCGDVAGAPPKADAPKPGLLEPAP